MDRKLPGFPPSIEGRLREVFDDPQNKLSVEKSEKGGFNLAILKADGRQLSVQTNSRFKYALGVLLDKKRTQGGFR
ncbi:MAG: hypothetical protein WC759_00050 [Candidatus Micrarchaeia archaeon]|jgi:hypothetical protein